MNYSYKCTKVEASTRKEAISKITTDSNYIEVNYIAEDNYKNYIGKKVNVKDFAYLVDLDLKELPITFGTVGGSFNCSCNKLTSLKGCPKKVGKNFDCSCNSLTSLKGCPKKVKCFYCDLNKLTSLKGSPREVENNFWCSDNYLTSLEGCPKKVNGAFACSHNKKQFTKEDVEKVCKVGRDIIV